MSLTDQQWCPTSAQVTVLQARGLRVKGKGGTNDAYALMQVGKEKYQTSVAEKSVAPAWREEAAFDLPPLPQQGAAAGERGTLRVHVLHRALVGPDKLLGQAVINLQRLGEDRARDKTEWFKLLDKTGKADKDRGEVLVDIQFMRNNMTGSMFDLSAAGKSRSRLGKFKDKVRGKKKESDAASSVVPSFPQVLTDSEEEANGEAAAGKDEKKKKHKMKSLFSHKSNLQKNMSQSMSVLPGKSSSLSGSQSSGLNVDSSEGKKKFKFMMHKRSGSSDAKDSSSGLQKHVEQSNVCINGSHVYCEEPQVRTSRIGSNFSLTSSGHGSMEDVPESSPPSVDSLRAVRQYSPWTEEEEEEEEEATAEVENITEDVDELKRGEEEMIRMEEERRRKEEELERLAAEKRRQEEEERQRIEAEEEKKVRKEEEERIRSEEKRKRLEEEEKRKRLEEEERVRMEEEGRRKAEQEEALERLAKEKRRQEEEEESVRREEEEKIWWEEKRKRLEEEERVRMEEEARRKAEQEVALVRLAEEKRRREEEEEEEEEERVRREEEERIRSEEERKRQEKDERVKKEEQERKRLAEEKRREEQETKIIEEEEQRQRKEAERIEDVKAQEARRRQEEEEENGRMEEEERRIEKEKVRKEEERAQGERRRKEEEELIRRQEHETKRRLEELERRQLEEEERIRKEEKRRQEEEERARKEKEEYEIMVEDRRKLEEQKREMIETEEKIKKEEEERKEQEAERIRVEEERKRKEQEAERVRRENEEREEKRRHEERERRRIEEEEQRQREEDERMRQEEERRREEEDRLRREKEEYERLVEEKRRLEEQERRQREEEERIGREEEEEAKKEKERVERLAEEKRRLEEQEKRRVEEEEKLQREEEEERRRRAEKKAEEARKLEDDSREDKAKDGNKTARMKSRVAVESHPAEVASTNPFDETFSNNPLEDVPDSGADGSTSKETNVQQRCQSAVSSAASKSLSADKKELVGAQREKRPAPRPPGRNTAESQREPDASKPHATQINERSNDKDVKTASVLPQRSGQLVAPLSCTDAKNPQSSPQSGTVKGTASVAKPSKRPAPSRPCSLEEEPSSKPKGVPSSGGNVSQGGCSETKQAPVVYGLNPFDDDEDELQDDTTTPVNAGSTPASSQTADEDAAAQAKLKSSKVARAPPPPAKTAATPSTVVRQNADGGHATDAATGEAVPDRVANQACVPQSEVVTSVPVKPVRAQSAAEAAGVRKEGPPTASRRLQPVKPLSPPEQQSVSIVQGGKNNKSTAILSEVQDKTKVNDSGLKGPYSQLTQQELISLVLKQENQLSGKDKQISELEQYIDDLLVRVIEEKPSILMSLASLRKAV